MTRNNEVLTTEDQIRMGFGTFPGQALIRQQYLQIEALRDALQRYLDCDPSRDVAGDTPARQAREALSK